MRVRVRTRTRARARAMARATGGGRGEGVHTVLREERFVHGRVVERPKTGQKEAQKLTESETDRFISKDIVGEIATEPNINA